MNAVNFNTDKVSMQEINSISELVDNCLTQPIRNFPAILRSARIPVQEFDNFASWDTQDYSRNCIERNDRFEILLLCWHPGDYTPIHGHDGQRCWVYQIDGKVEEKRYRDTEQGPQLVNTQVLKPGELSYMDDRMGFHVLSNPYELKSMSLHIYVSPIDKCKVFNSDNNCFETRELSYDKIIAAAI